MTKREQKGKPNRFFFNHKGIKGHASLVGEPDEKFMRAFWKMIEVVNTKKFKK